jgi:plastocyanin
VILSLNPTRERRRRSTSEIPGQMIQQKTFKTDGEDRKMRKFVMLAVGLAVVVGLWAIGTTIARAKVFSKDPRVAILDKCDPATFAAGGLSCAVLPHPADVTLEEFLALLFSPLIKTVVGHPAWRFEPSYLDIRPGQTLRVTNNGGEAHTFTEVTNFGGGSIALLNGAVSPPAPAGTVPLTLSPECPATPAGLGPIIVASGATVEVPLSPGEHKFQCCIHPWMRAVIGVGD